MSGTQFKQEIQPYIDQICNCANEFENPEDGEKLRASLSVMYGEGFIPPECFFECVLSPKGYKPGVYESLPAILPRYFAVDHPVVKPAYDAILAIFSEKYAK